MAIAAPLTGVRIIECSLLGPGDLATHLADLGAEVIKVEPPSGDDDRIAALREAGAVT